MGIFVIRTPRITPKTTKESSMALTRKLFMRPSFRGHLVNTYVVLQSWELHAWSQKGGTCSGTMFAWIGTVCRGDTYLIATVTAVPTVLR